MFEQSEPFIEHETGHEDVTLAEMDNLTSLAPQLMPEPSKAPNDGFQFPVGVWLAMLACYAVFLIALTLATGGSGHARFALIVSLGYVVIYFGLGRVMARQAGPEAPSPLNRGADLQTWCGPMDKITVYGQVLVVPACIALFGIGIALIIAWVG